MTPQNFGPYNVTRTIGRGGMGAVYEAVHNETCELAAIKALLDTFDGDDEMLLRFDVEIESLKRLNHPNIVRILASGVETGIHYYVMELVSGQSLSQELRKKRMFQWTEAAKIGLDVASALRHAHDRGITHRDIKPANILLNHNGAVKISDFGIAQLFDGQRLTNVNSVIGTLEYMSPEQALAGQVGIRTDFYSLGAVLYALLAGKPPFAAKSLPEILRKHATDTPEPLRSLRPDVPEAFNEIITNLLAVSQEQRFKNALVLSRRLQLLLDANVDSPNEIIVLPSPPAEKNMPKQVVTQHETTLVQSTDDIGKLIQHGSESFVSNAQPIVTKAAQAKQTDKCEQSEHPINDSKTLPSPLKDGNATICLVQNPTANISASSNPRSSSTNNPVVSSRFIRVKEDAANTYIDRTVSRPLISMQTIVALLMLIATCLTIVYMLQPVPADRLFERIKTKIDSAEGDDYVAAIRRAERDINMFLDNYSNDPQIDQIIAYKEELELANKERIFERGINRTQVQGLQPVERAYIEAVALSRIDPEQTIVKLRAIISLYSPNGSVSLNSSDDADTDEKATKSTDEKTAKQEPHRRSRRGPTENCLLLAQRRLNTLERYINSINREQRESLSRCLDEADNIEKASPARANEIRKAVIELYGNRIWAAELVERAREKVR
ncbi:MAG: serine/threonine protein kinase [Planctomycetaceae bacterium]|jgi:serine/threonine-protein kinase|nr:serine/threonine protein kinase [Planctomycetaceae bacterium]